MATAMAANVPYSHYEPSVSARRAYRRQQVIFLERGGGTQANIRQYAEIIFTFSKGTLTNVFKNFPFLGRAEPPSPHPGACALGVNPHAKLSFRLVILREKVGGRSPWNRRRLRKRRQPTSAKCDNAPPLPCRLRVSVRPTRALSASERARLVSTCAHGVNVFVAESMEERFALALDSCRPATSER